MNNLTVDHHHHHHHHHHQHQHHPSGRLTKPRRSVIGKLERSSFQAQRLSDVGIAFSQQITSKVGLKLPASQERIVEQTRWLYLRYVFVKLRQNKLPLKDLNLTRGSRSRRAAALLTGAATQRHSMAARGGHALGDLTAGTPEGSSSSSSPIVCISEPSTADVLTSLGDQGAMFARPPGIRPGRQSILSLDLDAQDLSLLNARASARRNQRLGATLAMPPETPGGGVCQEVGPNENSPPSPPGFNPRRALFGASGGARGIALPGKINPLTGAAAAAAAAAATSRAPLRSPLAAATSLLARPSSVTATSSKKYLMDPTINNQILTVITNMINELRESRPEFYGDTIYEVIGLDKFSSLESLLDVQRTICQEMTRADISWDRIVALFSLFGAMSLDCVRLGAPEHVGPILDGFIGFVERDLAQWISQQGGWESFLYKFRADFRYGPLCKVAAVALPLLLALLLAYN